MEKSSGEVIKTGITGIGDPFVLNDGDSYYLYATSSEKGFRCWRSKDLKSWTDCGSCYASSSWGENSFWAPEVYKREEKYYLLYTARWSLNHSLRTGLASSGSPEGPFADVTDGPLFDLGYATIDATLFFDDDGKIYLYYVRDCSENVIKGVHTSVIYGVEIDGTLTSFSSEPKVISYPFEDWEKQSGPDWLWNEGPAVIKHAGRYYLNYSANFYAGRDYCVGCSESDEPLGPFIKYPDNPILKSGAGDFSGPGHNSFFRTDDGRLMTAFHIHTDSKKPDGNRRACFAEAVFSKEGKMSIVY